MRDTTKGANAVVNVTDFTCRDRVRKRHTQDVKTNPLLLY